MAVFLTVWVLLGFITGLLLIAALDKEMGEEVEYEDGKILIILISLVAWPFFAFAYLIIRTRSPRG